jgi:Trypsin-like peptidase domain
LRGGRGTLRCAGSPGWLRSLLPWVTVLLLLLLLVGLGAPVRADASPAQLAAWTDSVVLLVTGPAMCSGFVIDDVGTVATAYHCVAGGQRPQVHPRHPLPGGVRAVIGRTVAASPRDDLALVSVPALAGQVKPLALREGEPLVGERVYGIGHPLAPAADRSRAMEGMLRWSVSQGIVSAVGPRLIQTDTALNPGNSGGPVVDVEGRVIGVASRKLRADNIAFLSRADLLARLLADQTPPRILGGQLSLGLLLAQVQAVDGVQTVMLRAGPTVRDHLVLEVAAGVSLDARIRAQATGSARSVPVQATVGLRQRVGRGAGTVLFEAGLGAFVLADREVVVDTTEGLWRLDPASTRVVPGGYAKLGLSVTALRLEAISVDGQPLLLLGIDVDVPGVLKAY